MTSGMRPLAHRFAAATLTLAAFHASGLVWCASPSGHAALEFFLTGCCQSTEHEGANVDHPGIALLGTCAASPEACTDFRLVLTGANSAGMDADGGLAEAPALASRAAPPAPVVPQREPFPDLALDCHRTTVLLT